LRGLISLTVQTLHTVPKEWDTVTSKVKHRKLYPTTLILSVLILAKVTALQL